jgi:dipeptide/tripeptide permease
LINRVLNLTAAVAAVAAAVAVCVVAASYAVYAVAEQWLSPAGAAAVVAAVFAAVALVAAWLATRKVVPKASTSAPPPTPVDQVIDLAKSHPLAALGVGAAAAFVLVRNPAIVTAVISAFVAGNASKPPK